jgi:hypothetical protein
MIVGRSVMRFGTSSLATLVRTARGPDTGYSRYWMKTYRHDTSLGHFVPIECPFERVRNEYEKAGWLLVSEVDLGPCLVGAWNNCVGHLAWHLAELGLRPGLSHVQKFELRPR